MASWALPAVAVGIWIYLLLFRGGFWREAPRRAPHFQPEAWPEVVAVIPARNEADVIAQSMSGLLAQDYPGRFTAILVDDDSADGTAATAKRLLETASSPHGLAVLRNESLAPGWTGKLWAVNRGTEEADRVAPEAKYVLLTDADIFHEPSSLRQLVARAEHRRLSLVSLMARLKTVTIAERALIPAYIFFFQKLYPFAWVSDPKRRMAGAAGGCMLVNRAALRQIGGIAAIRDELIDDCALGKALKSTGAIWLGLGDGVVSLHGYPRWRDVWMLIARSAFTQLGFSAAMLCAAVLSMLATYLLPPALALFAGSPVWFFGAAAWLMMAFAYQPTLRYYRLSPGWALVLPLVALFYTAATVDSALRYWSGRGGAWKGRLQAKPAEATSAERVTGEA
jgi:hopene-associated glycosyltransferase HpnB